MQYVGRKAQIHNVKLGEKVGRRGRISSIERKLHFEIHPWMPFKLYTIRPTFMRSTPDI
jgi:hypothetical protein